MRQAEEVASGGAGPLIYVYAWVGISSALLTATGTYRAVVSFFDVLHLPEFAVGACAGLLQLIWSDLAYLIAKPLKSVALYHIMPFFGATLNFCTSFLLLLRSRYALRVVMITLVTGTLCALCSLGILLKWGESDIWRVTALSVYIAANICWLLLFLPAFRQEIRGARSSLR